MRSDMSVPVAEFMSAASSLMAALDGIEINTSDFAPDSQAGKEDDVARRSGIDPARDIVSVSGTCLHLRLKLFAAREHLLGCLHLIGSKPQRMLANPVETLARCAVEASATCLWLCSNRITWEERLRRHSQLHINSAYNCLKESRLSSNLASPPPDVERDLLATQAESDAILDWVSARGWRCANGREPTISRWAKELPGYSEIVRGAADMLPLDPDLLTMRYSISSRSVHTDPVTVADDSSDAHERNRLFRALSATSTALVFYAYAWSLLASWCGVPYPQDAAQDHLIAAHGRASRL